MIQLDLSRKMLIPDDGQQAVGGGYVYPVGNGSLTVSAAISADHDIRLPLFTTAPKNAVKVRLEASSDQISLHKMPGRDILETGTDVTLEREFDQIILRCSRISREAGDLLLRVQYFDGHLRQLEDLIVRLTVFRLSLAVDADRDGYVDYHNPNKRGWKWGPQGFGAVLPVNCEIDQKTKKGQAIVNPSDSDADLLACGPLKLKDLCPIFIRKQGPDLPPGMSLSLQVTDATANKIRIYHGGSGKDNVVIGPGQARFDIKDIDSELELWAEALRYPSPRFDGLVTVELFLFYRDLLVCKDKVILRVAPWCMASTTWNADTIYITKFPKGENDQIIRDLQVIAGQAGVSLSQVPSDPQRGNHFLQDELEIGFSETPRRLYEVVLDSPNRFCRKGFVYKRLLGNAFAYIVRRDKNCRVSNLDKFGNLEVSPPLSVHGRHFPLGRIVMGGSLPGAGREQRLMRKLRRFLYAQAVQEPVEIHTNWLRVRHVDELLTFVPAPDTPKGFKLLLASPNTCYRLMREVERIHGGDVLMFEGRRRYGGGTSSNAAIPVGDLLENHNMMAANFEYQNYIEWNRSILKRELNLRDSDIIDVPVLFKHSRRGARAYFPNMVNMAVLGRHLVIPKPFGPKVEPEMKLALKQATAPGQYDVFETYMREELNPLGLQCYFIQDWEVYYKRFGNIHCGTNVLRRRPKRHNERWWDAEPLFSFSIDAEHDVREEAVGRFE